MEWNKFSNYLIHHSTIHSKIQTFNLSLTQSINQSFIHPFNHSYFHSVFFFLPPSVIKLKFVSLKSIFTRYLMKDYATDTFNGSIL
ncbi:hypothetical protein [Ignavibacterium album]|uniref:hypothetical protein n=1 Tax=Ignavibacterium album TaxID=591197 RepID=UPI00031BC18F|nr:hypothetical protein [Ignavibacterium album]